MTWKDLRLRLRALLFQRRVEDELDEELRFHIEMETRKNVQRGMPPAEAGRKVGVDFGGFPQVKEACREMRGLRLIETTLQDLRYAFSGFRRTPGFALTVIGTIALGLGLNTTLFTIFNAYVLQPLSVNDPYRLYQFTWANRAQEGHRFSWGEFRDFERQNPAFSEVVAFNRVSFARVEGHLMLGQMVTGNYFEMLGVTAMRGRTLLPADATVPGSAPVAVLSFDAWTNKFGSDPNILEKQIPIRGHNLQIVGVAQAGFRGLSEVPLDYWVPVTLAPLLEQDTSLFGPRQPERLTLVGRLRPDLTPRQAQTTLTAWAQRHTESLPDAAHATHAILRSRATVVPLEPAVVAAAVPVFVAFGMVLLIACANVANMMLARAMARQREIGIRLAMGAGRARLIRQLLTESVALAVPAAVAGFAISSESIRWGQWLVFNTMPASFREFLTMMPLQPDARVFCFMLAAAVLSAVLFGIAPAIQATRSSVMQAARGEFTTDFRPARLRSALVVLQVSVSVLLLICATVLIRINQRMQQLEVGLQPRGVVVMDLQERFRERVMQHLSAAAGIQQIAAAGKVPFEGYLPRVPVVAGEDSGQVPAGYLYASPEYFEVFQLPILRGRNFTRDEALSGAAVAIVSQATAQRLWPGRDAVGRELRILPNPQQRRSLADPRAGPPAFASAQVIGVARDAVNGWVGEGPDSTCVYFPTAPTRAGNALFVRVRGDAAAAVRRLDAMFTAATPGAVDQLHTMEDVLGAQIYPFRAMYWISAALGGLALLLTISGIYGVLSYVVTQRTKEIGIRVALGARPGAVAALVLRQSMRFAFAGAIIGGTAAIGLLRLVASQVDMKLLGSLDWLAVGTGMALVSASSAAAAWLPSRRAAGIEPVSTLRCD
ncbi:MAG: ADOP family duplicated permease [Candidatus Solibacter sp.]